jgi:hypothetical protein
MLGQVGGEWAERWEKRVANEVEGSPAQCLISSLPVSASMMFCLTWQVAQRCHQAWKWNKKYSANVIQSSLTSFFMTKVSLNEKP